MEREWNFGVVRGPLTAGVPFSDFGPAMFGSQPWLVEICLTTIGMSQCRVPTHRNASGLRLDHGYGRPALGIAVGGRDARRQNDVGAAQQFPVPGNRDITVKSASVKKPRLLKARLYRYTESAVADKIKS